MDFFSGAEAVFWWLAMLAILVLSVCGVIDTVVRVNQWQASRRPADADESADRKGGAA